jgi:cytochrome c-type biogenesis protein CcmH
MTSTRQNSVLTQLLAIALLAGIAVSSQAVELRDFKSVEQRARFMDLSNELRCLVCQNQSLADSDAPLAQDLRRQVHEMLDKGQTNDEITDFMVARYGNFVRYKPPFSGATLVLWIGPFVLALLGLWLLIAQLRRRSQTLAATGAELSQAEREQLAGLLHDTAEKRTS